MASLRKRSRTNLRSRPPTAPAKSSSSINWRANSPKTECWAKKAPIARSSNGRKWIIDPIDGTRDFVRGIPLWAVLIGLEQDGEIVAGAAHSPRQGLLLWAGRGTGAWANGSPLHVSDRSDPADAVLSFNGFNKVGVRPFAPGLLSWVQRFWAVRSLGGAVDAMLLAQGQADVWIEPNAQPWDLAPLKLLIEEAGGKFASFTGENSIYGGNAYACAPGLESYVRELLSSNGEHALILGSVTLDLLHLLFRFIHIGSVILLLGGVFYARQVLVPVLNSLPEDLRMQSAAGSQLRFRTTLWVLLILIVGSGIIQLFWADRRTGRSYQIAFGIKMLFVAHILASAILWSTSPYGDVTIGGKSKRRLLSIVISGLIVVFISAYLRALSQRGL